MKNPALLLDVFTILQYDDKKGDLELVVVCLLSILLIYFTILKREFIILKGRFMKKPAGDLEHVIVFTIFTI